MSDAIARLRALLAGGEGPKCWERVVELFTSWPDQGAKELGLSYAATHITEWAKASPEAMLHNLLGRWPTSHSAALAELIERLSGLLLAKRGAISGVSQEQRDAALVALWNEGDPLDLPRLLCGLEGASPHTARWLLQEVRQRYIGDPRVAKPLLALLEQPPKGLQGKGALPFWGSVTYLLSHCRDPRLIEPLQALARKCKIPGWHKEKVKEFLAYDLPVTVEVLIRQTSITRGERHQAEVVLCAACAAQLLPEVERPIHQLRLEALFAQVYQEPHDDAPRLALAEALMALGEPRGRFIALQCEAHRRGRLSREERRQEAALRKAHLREWLGPLKPLVVSSGLSFVRGFPAKVKLCASKDPSLWEEAIGLAQWATIETLDMTTFRGPHRELLCGSPFRALKTILGAREVIFAAEASEVSLGVTSITMDYVIPLQLPSLYKRFAACSLFPGLESFDFGRGTRPLEALLPFFSTPMMGTQIRHVGLGCLESLSPLHEALPTIEQSACTSLSFCVEGQEDTLFTITRETPSAGNAFVMPPKLQSFAL